MLHYPISNLHYGLYHTLLRLSRSFLQFRIHCQPHIPPILACLHHHSSVSFQIECDFNTGSGGHLLSDPGGAPYESRTHVTAVKEQCLDHLTNGAYLGSDMATNHNFGSCLSQNVTDSLHINGTIVVPTAYFSRYKPSGLCYASR